MLMAKFCPTLKIGLVLLKVRPLPELWGISWATFEVDPFTVT